MNGMKDPEVLTIDAHCHLFNRGVLSWRLLVDFILSRAHHPKPRARFYGMMEKFPGLHTDLSCITEAAKLREMREYFLKAPEQVRRKFLFGSDFYLNLLFLDGMKEYMENFRNTFTEQERQELMTVNPSEFLGLS